MCGQSPSVEMLWPATWWLSAPLPQDEGDIWPVHPCPGRRPHNDVRRVQQLLSIQSQAWSRPRRWGSPGCSPAPASPSACGRRVCGAAPAPSRAASGRRRRGGSPPEPPYGGPPPRSPSPPSETAWERRRCRGWILVPTETLDPGSTSDPSDQNHCNIVSTGTLRMIWFLPTQKRSWMIYLYTIILSQTILFKELWTSQMICPCRKIIHLFRGFHLFRRPFMQRLQRISFKFTFRCDYNKSVSAAPEPEHKCCFLMQTVSLVCKCRGLH